MLLNVRQSYGAGLLLKRDRAQLPRVAFALALDPSQKFGSMEEQIVLLAERFQAEDSLFAPIFICHPNGDAGQFLERGIDTACIDLSVFSLRSLQALRRFVQSRRINLIHWNFVAPLANPYLWWMSALAPRVHNWFTDHNSRTFPLKPHPLGVKKLAKGLLLRRYQRVICVSQYVQDCLQDQGVWSNLVSELHFINTDRFCPDSEEGNRKRAELNATDRFVLVSVGQLIVEKGMHIAVRALSMLPARVVLWIVGGGPEESALRELIADLRLEDRVRLLGQQRHVQPYLQAADCFVCPSLWGEAAGLVNIEAQACGAPVIASRIGGIPEYVADERTGFLFTPGDADDLARCVRRLLDEPTLCAAMAQSAREHAVEHFSTEHRLNAWIELYRGWRK